ncbi:MAG: hypothetical protein KDA99_11960, partial [Planctomycetales bacterium]|nr:hypothetical protein [Planctomycetales bacterium]
MEPPQNAAKPETGGFSWLTLLSGAMFVIVAVALRGVRWDETYEHAQIITGQVVYPRGHPLALYVHNAFSFQTLFSAFLLQGGLGSTYLCGLRNVLFLGLSIMPVSILAAGITRSTLAGFVASALLLQGIMLEFDGSYPAMIWPEIYSNGPIGGGVVLIAVAALALGWWRVAFFLAGVVPAIHVGQWPPLAGTVFFMAALALFRGRPDQSGRGREATVGASFGYAAAGMACTILFWFVHRHFILPLAETGPFAARAGAGAVWQGYTYLHDPHRAFPPGNGHVILIGAIVLCALGAVYGVSGRFRVACACLTIFCGLAGAAVWGIMAIHGWLGPHMPFLLIAWMPYRLINLVPPVALAVMVGAIVARWPARGWWFLMAALLVGALQPLWPYVLGAA